MIRTIMQWYRQSLEVMKRSSFSQISYTYSSQGISQVHITISKCLEAHSRNFIVQGLRQLFSMRIPNGSITSVQFLKGGGQQGVGAICSVLEMPIRSDSWICMARYSKMQQVHCMQGVFFLSAFLKKSWMHVSNLGLNFPSLRCIILIISLLCCSLKSTSSTLLSMWPYEDCSKPLSSFSNQVYQRSDLPSLRMQTLAHSRTLERQQPMKLVKQLSLFSIFYCAFSRNRYAMERLSDSLASRTTFCSFLSLLSIKSSMKESFLD